PRPPTFTLFPSTTLFRSRVARRRCGRVQPRQQRRRRPAAILERLAGCTTAGTAAALARTRAGAAAGTARHRRLLRRPPCPAHADGAGACHRTLLVEQGHVAARAGPRPAAGDPATRHAPGRRRPCGPGRGLPLLTYTVAVLGGLSPC